MLGNTGRQYDSKYNTLGISLNFSIMEKMKIASSEPKDYQERSGKGIITSLGLKTIIRSKKKKARYAINNVSITDISNIIKEFGYLFKEGYVRRRSKHVPTDSYFYLARQLAKRTMRVNMRVCPLRMKMTNTQKMNCFETSTQNIPNLHVCYLESS